MKKTSFLLLFLLLFLTDNIVAQSSWSLEASAGTGASGTITSGKSGNNIGISGAQFSLLLQYQVGKFMIGSGISYLKAGYENSNNDYLNNHTPIIFGEQLRTKHIVVPIRIGYELQMGQRFSLMPTIGAACSYNINARFRMDGIGTYEQQYSGASFEQLFNRYSLWAHAGLQLSCNTNENLYLLAGLQAQGMITGFQKEVPANDNNLRLMNINMNLGLGYRF